MHPFHTPPATMSAPRGWYCYFHEFYMYHATFSEHRDVCTGPFIEFPATREKEMLISENLRLKRHPRSAGQYQYSHQ